ncbi:MAG: TIGR02453 family protein, partial [Bacteroidia bacterium]|nr:TIGR02453 family protein [Bacteroidia bacterium]
VRNAPTLASARGTPKKSKLFFRTTIRIMPLLFLLIKLMFPKEGLEFLTQLKANNNKTWFAQHKKEYETFVKEPFKQIVTTIVQHLIPQTHLSEHIKISEYIFRIYRDVRFTKNKLPFKTFLGAYLDHEGTQSDKPGYYIHIEPKNSFIACGLYEPNAEQLKKIRQEIVYETDTWQAILAHPSLLKYWGGLYEGRRYKKIPKDVIQYPELCNYTTLKQFLLWKYIPDEIVTSQEYVSYCVNHFLSAVSFVNFLRQAIS